MELDPYCWHVLIKQDVKSMTSCSQLSLAWSWEEMGSGAGAGQCHIIKLLPKNRFSNWRDFAWAELRQLGILHWPILFTNQRQKAAVTGRAGWQYSRHVSNVWRCLMMICRYGFNFISYLFYDSNSNIDTKKNKSLEPYLISSTILYVQYAFLD